MKLAVLGAGSWGTALAVHYAHAGHQVILWSRSTELAETLDRERRSERYLPGVELPASLRVTADVGDATAAETVLIVVPSHGFRDVARGFLRRLPTAGGPITVVSATKGIETDTLARMSEVIFEEAVAADRTVRYAVLSGPNFAAELVAGAPTSAVVASEEGDLATELREGLSTGSFRLYSSTDVAGVELGGASKNVIAVAAGVVTGLELGHNALAALMTRGLHEITRLGLAYGGMPRTFSGLAGMGDLVLTCTGPLSRNRRLGVELAAGKSAEEIASATSMVAEGFRNSRAIARLAERRGVEMPITEQMVEILYRGKAPRQAVKDLMARERRAEAEL